MYPFTHRAQKRLGIVRAHADRASPILAISSQRIFT